MFRLYSVDDEYIGVADKLTHVRRHTNGCYVLCSEKEAQGIAFNGEVYSLGGVYGFEDRPIVRIEYTDTAVELENTNNTTGIAFVTMAESGSIDAVTMSEHAEVFAAWAYPVAYKAGNIRRDPVDGCLYKVNEGQGHTSQEDWPPRLTPSMWTKIADPAEEWPAWSQPIGAHDAYGKYAKTTHNQKKWTSDCDNNVWEPGVYGWTEYVES